MIVVCASRRGLSAFVSIHCGYLPIPRQSFLSPSPHATGRAFLSTKGGVLTQASPSSTRRVMTTPQSTSAEFSSPPIVTVASVAASAPLKEPISLYRSEGLFPVYKPMEWTSNDVVAYIRGILERDARNRGAKPDKIGYRRQGKNKNKDQTVKVGHGGTLDPLATGVLVIGVGKGTKQLQR